MNREELKSILPHREPMLLLDEAFVKDGGIAVAGTLCREMNSFCRGISQGSRLCRVSFYVK